MAIDIREILSTPVDDIERPKSIPKCHLLADIPSPGYEFGVTKGNGTPFVRWHFKNLQPGPDAPEGLSEEFNLGERDLRIDMWATPKALNRMDRMLDAILGPNTNKRTCFERLPDTNGMPVMIQVSPRLNEDGSDTGYNDVISVTARPEE